MNDLLLEEVPDISYADIGGLDEQIEQITDAVELPFLHQHLFGEYDLPAPKGILLYGPPGCGKTLIAKALANSLAKKIPRPRATEIRQLFFVDIKGPELLNKYLVEPSAISARCFNVLARRRQTAPQSLCSSMRWNHCFAPADLESALISNQRSCLNCSPRSTVWRR